MAQRSCKTLGANLDKMNTALDKIEDRLGTRKEKKNDRKVYNKVFNTSMKTFQQLQKCKPKK